MEQTRVVEREAGLEEEPSFVEQGGKEEALQGELEEGDAAEQAMQGEVGQALEAEDQEAAEAEDVPPIPWERAWLPQHKVSQYVPLARDWRPAWDGHRFALSKRNDLYVNASSKHMSNNAVQLEIQFSDGRRANHTGLRRSHGEVLGCVLPSGAPWPADPGPGDPRVRGHPDAGGLLEAAERHNPVHDGALDEGDLDLWPGASWLYMVLGLRLA